MATLRDFRPGDEAAFRRLNEAWLRRHFAIEPKDEAVFADPAGQILSPGGIILFLEDEGAPIGCVALLRRDAETFEVGKMTVDESHRGRGLGRELLIACVARARERGARRLYLETNRRLATAVALYRSFGFVEIDPAELPRSEYRRADLHMAMEI